MARPTRLPRCGAAAVLALVALTLAAAPASARPPAPGTTIERPVNSVAPDADVVRETYVRVYEPLPETAGPHPRRCDWIGYLRFRSAGGPGDPSRADAVLVGMPGILAGASMHDRLARNVVRHGSLAGLSFEYWALDRRANCLEDRRGIAAARRAGDASVAWEYYWGDREVRGRRFTGFADPLETQFLSEIGLEQTVRDEFAVIRNGIPERRVRRERVFCGGHSLGGPLTTALAGWDLDGDPETKADAGYRQCAGFFGLDTSLGFGSGEGSPVGVAGALALATKASPYVSVPPLTPETSQLIAAVGVGAFYDPHGTDLLGQIPETPMISLSQRMLYSRDAVNFVTQTPSIRDFTITNETVLGGILDDNSQPVTILRTSLGTTDGGPLTAKDFPLPSALGLPVPLFNNRFIVIPEDPEAPLYGWRDYDQMETAPASSLVAEGTRFTSAASEVSDIRDLARQMFEAPANWAEQYFPTRIATDVGAAGEGDRSGGLENLIYDGIARRPALLVQAGDGDLNSGPRPRAGTAEPPNGLPRSDALVLPGYNHIDVVAAAWDQPSGQPEPASAALADFVRRVLGRGR